MDMFFVLSGYLISGLLLRELDATGRIDLSAFYARRLRRLLPALALMIFVILGMAAAILSTAEFAARTASSAYAASWASNLYFAFFEVDYFGEDPARDLFLHTWSLGIEEQFYLFWPVLLLMGRRALMPTLGCVVAVSAALSWHWQPLWAFYLTPARFWQFALGASVFVALDRRPARAIRPQVANLLGLGGLASILASATLLGEMRAQSWLLLPSAGTAALIAAGHERWRSRPSRMLSSGFFHWIGDRSYSWYLWHWPILAIGFALGLRSFAWALAALSLALAAGSYRWVERPLWKGRWSASRPARQTILSALVSVAALLLGYQQLLRALPRDPASPDVALALAARTDRTDIYDRGCDGYLKSTEVRPCIVGDATAATRDVLLVGDSVGVQWLDLVTTLFPPPGWKTAVLTKSACPMVDKELFYARIGKTFEACTNWRNSVLDYVDVARPDVVMLGSSIAYSLSAEDWTSGSARIVARLSKAAGHVVVIAGTPLLDFDGPDCVLRRAARELRLPLAIAETCEMPAPAQPARVAAYLRAATRPYPNASVIDFNDLVCPNQRCRARMPDGTMVYRDAQHLTRTFVRRQAEAVRLRVPAQLQLLLSAETGTIPEDGRRLPAPRTEP